MIPKILSPTSILSVQVSPGTQSPLTSRKYKTEAHLSAASKSILAALHLRSTENSLPAENINKTAKTLSRPLKNSQLNQEQRQLSLDAEKTASRLKELQSTLPYLDIQNTPTSPNEIRQCFLNYLNQEQHQDNSVSGRVYCAVLSEESELQGKQILSEEKRRVSDEFYKKDIPYDKLSYHSRRSMDDFSQKTKIMGEIDFLKHKLAIIDYCKKVNNLYITAEWNPTEATCDKLHRHQSDSAENLNGLDVEKLLTMAQLTTQRSSAKRHYVLDKTAKYTFKYFPAYTITVYPFIRKKLNTDLEYSQKSLQKIDDGIRMLCHTGKIKKNKIDSAIAKKLMEPVSGEDKLNQQINVCNQVPIVSSLRGNDPDTGLYHETQFSNSGTCLLHGNNHYLSAWHSRQDKPFLALTPRRMELLVNALVQSETTRLSRTFAAAVIEGKLPVHYKEILATQENGYKAILAKYAEYGKNIAANYNFNLEDSSSSTDNIVLTTQIGTGDFRYTGIIDFINRSLIGGKQVTHNYSLSEWSSHMDTLQDLEQNHGELSFVYSEPSKGSGHGMCFSKKDNQWYLQDSHFDNPIRCTPSELISHLQHTDTSDSALSSVNYHGNLVTFRDHHELTKNVSIVFSHWS